MATTRWTTATRAICDALLQFSLQEGTYGRRLVAAAGLPGGTVYPILARLSADGILESAEEDIDPAIAGRPRRRYWRFTEDGARLAQADRFERQQAIKVTGSTPGRLVWGSL